MRKNPMLNNERMLNDAIFMFSVRRARGEGKERGGGERERKVNTSFKASNKIDDYAA